MSMKLSTNLNLWSVDETSKKSSGDNSSGESEIEDSIILATQWLTLATMFEDDSFEVFDGD